MISLASTLSLYEDTDGMMGVEFVCTHTRTVARGRILAKNAATLVSTLSPTCVVCTTNKPEKIALGGDGVLYRRQDAWQVSADAGAHGVIRAILSTLGVPFPYHFTTCDLDELDTGEWMGWVDWDRVCS